MKDVMKQHMSERFGKVFNFSENPSLPKSLNIEINNTCNHKCVFCPYHSDYSKVKIKAKVMDYRNVIRILDEAKKLGIGEKEVGFYLSGEAFLHKDLINIVRYAKKIGFQYIFLTTNGALATPDKVKDILDAGLDSIRFSINAADRNSYKKIHGRDDFDKVYSNIRFLNSYIRQNGLNVATSISCVITNDNKGIQYKIKELFSDMVDDFLFIPVILDKEKYEESIINEYQLIDDTKGVINSNYICPLLFDTMYINANMEIIPCCDGYSDEYVFYDLKQDFNLINAWNCDKYKLYRNIFLKKQNDDNTLCKKCILRMSGIDRLGLKESGLNE